MALDLSSDPTGEEDSYDAYERLLLDIVNGDQTLFMRSDEVEAVALDRQHYLQLERSRLKSYALLIRYYGTH